MLEMDETVRSKTDTGEVKTQAIRSKESNDDLRGGVDETGRETRGGGKARGKGRVGARGRLPRRSQERDDHSGSPTSHVDEKNEFSQNQSDSMPGIKVSLHGKASKEENDKDKEDDEDEDEDEDDDEDDDNTDDGAEEHEEEDKEDEAKNDEANSEDEKSRRRRLPRDSKSKPRKDARASEQPTEVREKKQKQPYVRLAELPKEKLSSADLDAKMAAMAIKNAKLLERKHAADQDAAEYQQIEIENKKKYEAQRLQQQEIDAVRQTAAERKLGKVQGREWDREKTDEDWNRSRPYIDSMTDPHHVRNTGFRGGKESRGRGFYDRPRGSPRSRGTRGRGGNGRLSEGNRTKDSHHEKGENEGPHRVTGNNGLVQNDENVDNDSSNKQTVNDNWGQKGDNDGLNQRDRSHSWRQRSSNGGFQQKGKGEGGKQRSKNENKGVNDRGRDEKEVSGGEGVKMADDGLNEGTSKETPVLSKAG